jgi:hypothetical protein
MPWWGWVLIAVTGVVCALLATYLVQFAKSGVPPGLR